MNSNLPPIQRLFKGTALLCLCLIFGYSPLFGQNSKIDAIKKLPKTKEVKQFSPSDIPLTPNPFLSLLPPDTEPDYEGWRDYNSKMAQYRINTFNNNNLNNSTANSRVSTSSYDEMESESGENDTQETGEELMDLGSMDGQDNHVLVMGASGPDGEITYADAVANAEDEGSIDLATMSGLVNLLEGEKYTGVIGDGPEGLSDFDFFAVEMTAGTAIDIEVLTEEPFGDLDPFVSIWNAAGDLLDFNDDGFFDSWDSKLTYVAPEDGTYYVCVAGYNSFIPNDPFDSESGSITELIGSEGTYDMFMVLLDISDIDYYLVNLKEGDVLGAAINSNVDLTILEVFKPSTDLAVASLFSTTGIYPEDSPLSQYTGNTSTYHIAEEDGLYAVVVSNNYGQYDLDLTVNRPKLDGKSMGNQIIFLDYDGSDFDLFEFFGIPDGEDIRTLSPFRDFLDDWGLPNDIMTVQNLTARITDAVRENLEDDLEASGINENFDVFIIGNNGVTPLPGTSMMASSNPMGNLDQNSMALLQANGISDGPFGEFPIKFSRVIVGGTIPESGIGTIGIAQSIDPGNFDITETALVLLDILSSPGSGSNANFTFSLNDVVLDPSVSKEDMIVIVLSNIIAHEIGHYLGNWHTDGLDLTQNLMDEGPGGLFNLAGIGASGVFGDAETIDVDFVSDTYSLFESNFFGVENTTNQTAWALSSKPLPFSPFASFNKARVGAKLSQNYPNPGSVSTSMKIDFNVEKSGPVRIELYDLTGRPLSMIYSGMAEGGQDYQIEVNPTEHNLNNGIYIYKLFTSTGTISKRLYLTK